MELGAPAFKIGSFSNTIIARSVASKAESPDEIIARDTLHALKSFFIV